MIRNYHLHPVFEFDVPRGVAFWVDLERAGNPRPHMIMMAESLWVELRFSRRMSNAGGPPRLLAEKADWIKLVGDFRLRLDDEITFVLGSYGVAWGYIFDMQISRSV